MLVNHDVYEVGDVIRMTEHGEPYLTGVVQSWNSETDEYNVVHKVDGEACGDFWPHSAVELVFTSEQLAGAFEAGFEANREASAEGATRAEAILAGDEAAASFLNISIDEVQEYVR